MIGHRWIDVMPDSDTDGALFFLLQNLWYGETLLKYGWIRDRENDSTNLCSVLWLSADPVDLVAVKTADWDAPEAR
jgi:hypothetical protein